eukprot:3113036-Lingulodinium_polyedra.AAC.1
MWFLRPGKQALRTAGLLHRELVWPEAYRHRFEHARQRLHGRVLTVMDSELPGLRRLQGGV